MRKRERPKSMWCWYFFIFSCFIVFLPYMRKIIFFLKIFNPPLVFKDFGVVYIFLQLSPTCAKLIFFLKYFIPHLSLYINNTEIELIHEFLGIRLDEQLSFKYQIAHIRGKVAIIYNSLIKPHIEYGAAIWGPKVTTTMIKPLITLKKKAIRNICNTAYNSHTEALKKTLNFLQKCPP